MSRNLIERPYVVGLVVGALGASSVALGAAVFLAVYAAGLALL